MSDIEVSELRNEVARLKQQLEDAHNEVDLLETVPPNVAGVPFPCPPRKDPGGGEYTVAGRLDQYRQHHECKAFVKKMVP